ncbi:MAG: hypothetical protein F4X39_01330, partial [Acidobacteriia bacterium]|nr:hypothetical protein [Terriglobia bacterium]
MKALSSALFMVVFGIVAAAQPTTGAAARESPEAAENDKFPLREILIDGNANFATEDIIEVLGLDIGQMVNRADFESAVGKLDKTGVFEGYAFRFGPKDDGYTVPFTVQEAPELYA